MGVLTRADKDLLDRAYDIAREQPGKRVLLVVDAPETVWAEHAARTVKEMRVLSPWRHLVHLERGGTLDIVSHSVNLEWVCSSQYCALFVLDADDLPPATLALLKTRVRVEPRVVEIRSRAAQSA